MKQLTLLLLLGACSLCSSFLSVIRVAHLRIPGSKLYLKGGEGGQMNKGRERRGEEMIGGERGERGGEMNEGGEMRTFEYLVRSTLIGE